MPSIKDIDSDKDYYQILNIPKDASSSQIKRAYKKLAMKYHPDRNMHSKHSAKKFYEVVEAYEILKDLALKQAYDMYLSYKIPMGGY